MRFGFSRSSPRRKPPQFAIIAIVSHPHLGSDEQDLAIVDDKTAVVKDVFVHHWPVRPHHSDSSIGAGSD